MNRKSPALRRLSVATSLAGALFATMISPATGAQVPGSAETGESRVIGGREITSMENNPGAVALRSPTWELACSGVRIAPKWVLTARHCVEQHRENMPTPPDRVYTNSLRYGEGAVAKAKRRLIAPKGDLGLIELDTEPPGPIAKWGATTPTNGERMRALGWGRTGLSAPVSRNLKEAFGTYVGPGTSELFPGGQDLRVRGSEGRPFKGDSGGPLLNAQGTVVAVVSWGDPSDPSRSAVVSYAAIEQVKDWIATTTGTTAVP